MICLVIHFSDMHIADKDTLSAIKINDIIKTINYQIEETKAEKIIFVFSGDLTYSCQEEEFAIFNNFIKTITNGISLKKDNLFFLSPGNHDINFNKTPISRKTILQKKRDDIVTLKNHYLSMMANFYGCANNYYCFLDNKEIDTHIITLGGISIKINNINTAIFSTYKDDVGDNDRALHYLEDSLFDKMKRDNCEIVLTIMHHSPDWFDEQTIYKLKDNLKNVTDILLCGHEHVNDELDYNFSNGVFTKKICGGPLSPGDVSLFNCVIIDSDRKKYKTRKFEWNDEEGYKMINNDEEKYFTKYTCLKSSFYNSLLTDHLITNTSDFRDFYVFPELIVESEFNDVEKTISSIKEFKKETFKKNVCIINGSDYSGKTSLCKYLFLSYINEGLPVLFDLKSLDKNRISRIIANAYEDQYDQKLMSYSKFQKEDRCKKIAIVDDADKIDKEQFELLVEELKKNFGLVIIINGLKSEYDLLELTKKHLANSDDCLYLKIGKFYNNERKQLIKKTCALLASNLNESEIEKRTNFINKAVLNKIKLFNLYPPFIILFVKSMIDNGFTLGTKDVFNEVFSSNITKMMTETNVEVSLMNVLLQRIAYFIHTHKEYPLSQESLLDIISTYNKESDGYRPVINTVSAINDLIKCRLIVKTRGGNSYCFSNNSFLAYFIAKEWLRVQDENVLLKIIDNVCFGINSDILLYISFMYENSQSFFFNKILSSANSHFEKCEEMDFLKNNVKFVLQDEKDLLLQLPTSDRKDKAQEEIKKQEKEITRDSKLNYIDIYDYDDDAILDDLQTLTKGIKYIEILSKILPDFILKMDPAQIKCFVDSIYRFPNKLLFKALKPLDEEIDKKTSEDFLSGDVRRFEFDESVKGLLDISKIIILSTYDLVARFAVSKNTIVALEKFQIGKNLNYLIQKSLFYSELGDTEKFDKTIMLVYNETKNKSIRNMVKRIYFNHLLYNQIEYRGEVQAHISLLFPSINKPNKGIHGKNKFLTFIRTKKKK